MSQDDGPVGRGNKLVAHCDRGGGSPEIGVDGEPGEPDAEIATDVDRDIVVVGCTGTKPATLDPKAARRFRLDSTSSITAAAFGVPAIP